MKHFLVLFVLLPGLSCPGQSFRLLPSVSSGRVSLRAVEPLSATEYLCAGGWRASTSAPERAFIKGIVQPSGAGFELLFEPGTIVISIHTTASGDHLVIGQGPVNQAFVCRLGPLGTVLWRTNLSGFSNLRDVVEGPDGTIWACGETLTTLLMCRFSPDGTLIAATSAPLSGFARLKRLVPDGMTMLAFGEKSGGVSVRRFDLLGTELSHKSIGSSLVTEDFHDVARTPSGDFILVAQYAYPATMYLGRQELSVMRLTSGLSYVPSATRAYIESSGNLVNPRVLVDATHLYVSCTKTPSVPTGGTVVACMSLETGAVIGARAVARGSTRTHHMSWNAGNLVVSVCQDSILNTSIPPEKKADIALVSPTTLGRTTVPCETEPALPSIVPTTYYGTVVSTNLSVSVWTNTSITGAPGLMPEESAFIVYDDCADVLPVELISFSAAYNAVHNHVVLDWSTASEQGSDYFEVERSSDGVTFLPIGERILAAGDSWSMTSYAAIDPSPLRGQGYYRLKQVDRDGTFVYSSAVSVFVGFGATDVVEAFDVTGHFVSVGAFGRLASGTYLVRLAGTSGALNRVFVLQ